ncbi:MAG: fructosamine kinase family protein [Acidimicrobiales bacterium]
MGGPGPVRRADGRLAHVKRDPGAPEGFFATEAEGLAWLAEARAVPVPEVLCVDRVSIAVAWVAPGPATAAGAEEFGRALADLHAAGAPGFGAPWPGFIGPLPMDNRPAEGDPSSWSAFYAERRVLPALAEARTAGSVTGTQAAVVERALHRLPELAGQSAAEPPSRLHGDLWSGNLVFDVRGTVWVVDPAAHGGHRETDLAMLALFGAPHLDRILAAYDEHRPLAEGWRERVGFHQLHPLLVHAALFGPPYGARAASVARRYVGS